MINNIYLVIFSFLIFEFAQYFFYKMFYYTEEHEKNAKSKIDINSIPVYISEIIVLLNIRDTISYIQLIFSSLILILSIYIFYHIFHDKKYIDDVINSSFSKLPTHSLYKYIRYPNFFGNILFIMQTILYLNNFIISLLIFFISFLFYIIITLIVDKKLSIIYVKFKEYMQKSKRIIPYII